MSIGNWALAVTLAAGLSGTATAGWGVSVGVAGHGGAFGFSYAQPGWGGYHHYHPGYAVGGYYAAPRYYYGGPRVVYADPVVVAQPTYIVQPAPTYVVPAQPTYQAAPPPAQYPQYQQPNPQQYQQQPYYQPATAPQYQSAPINVPATPNGRVPPPPPQPVYGNN